jgi:phenylalanyl-tRNA synthetase alpha subunit
VLVLVVRLANEPGGFKPRKYFSIDRVFRNESMDATHLCEFHQVPPHFFSKECRHNRLE